MNKPHSSESNSAVIVTVVGLVALVLLLGCGGVMAIVFYGARQAAREIRDADLQARAAQQRAAEEMERAAAQLQAVQREQEAALQLAEQQQLEAAAQILGQTAGDMEKIYGELEKLGVDVGEHPEALKQLQDTLKEHPEQAEQLKALLEALKPKPPAEPGADSASDSGQAGNQDSP